MSLEHEMRNVLARMALIQEGATQSFDTSGGKGESDTACPQGSSWSMYDKWLARWDGDPSHGTLEAARADLQSWIRRAAPASGDGSSEDDWIVEDGRNLTPADAAVRFKRTASYIRNLRKAKGLDTETGFKRGALAPLVSDAVRIRNLAGQGCTERQIAFQVGVGKSTVRRALGRAA